MTTMKSAWAAGQVGSVEHRRKQLIWRPHPWMETGKALKVIESVESSMYFSPRTKLRTNLGVQCSAVQCSAVQCSAVELT
jgi:hypothetical protein